MFKDVLNHMIGAADYASIGLVIFFVVFVAVSLRAILRSRRDVQAWARLPLADEPGWGGMAGTDGMGGGKDRSRGES